MTNFGHKVHLTCSCVGFLTDSNISKEKESSREREVKSNSLQRVKIVDANQVYDALNLGRRIDVVWPDESMRLKGGQSYWLNWVPEDGMEGVVSCSGIPSK